MARSFALALALLPGWAGAHSSSKGFEGFYIGLVHPLTSPAQVLVLLALGLFFAQRWPRQFEPASALFAGGCLVGIVLGQAGMPVGAAEPVMLVLALAAGGLAALWPTAPALPPIAVAGGAGLLIGLVSTPDPGSLRATVITLFGSFVGAILALLYAAGGLGWVHEKARVSWAQMGFRVAAAWIAAIAALLLALSLTSVSHP